MAHKILFVEDDPLFGETITEFLEDEGFTVSHHLDSASAMDTTFDEKFQLYLFDLNLPSFSGIELLRELRSASDDTPAIFLTSSDNSEDLKEAFTHGADGYITKPVDLDELILRINALIKRVYGDEKLTYLDFSFDLKQSSLYQNGQRVILKPKTLSLFLLLVQHKNRVVTTQTIEERLWGSDTPASMSVIRVYITEIKQLIGAEKIENIRGVGYCLHD